MPRRRHYTAALFEDEALTVDLGTVDISDAETDLEAMRFGGERAAYWLADRKFSRAAVAVKVLKDGAWLMTFPTKIQHAQEPRPYGPDLRGLI
jgi:hypothetical protein